MRNIIIELVALDTTTNTDTTIRLASITSDVTGTTLDGKLWTPAIVAGPVFDLSRWDGAPKPLDVSYGQVVFAISPALGNYDWTKLVFNGKIATIWFGETDKPFASYRKIYTGLMGPMVRNDDQTATINLLGPEASLKRDLLSASYAGTGGAEGPASMTGTLKPYAIGACTNVEPILIDSTYLVYQYHGYGSCPVSAVYEGGISHGAPKVTVSTYAALIAATLDNTKGEWAACPALGMFRLGNKPTGVINADVGSTATIGSIATAFVQAAGLGTSRIDAASFNAASRPYNDYLTEQASVIDLVRERASYASKYLIADSAGKFFLADEVSSKTPGNLTSDRSTYPLVLPDTIRQEPPASPVWRVKVGHTRVYGVLSSDQVLGGVAKLADDLTAAQAAAQAAQDKADGGAADAAFAKARLNNQTLDSVLDRTEKLATVSTFEGYTAERASKLASASGFGITTEATAYSNAYDALKSYLESIGYSDTSYDSPINATTHKARFDAYLVARTNLDSAIFNATAKLANWTNVANRPTNLTDLNSLEGLKLGGIAAGATKNVVTQSASAPASPTDGDIWVNTSVTPTITYNRLNGAWVVGANYVTNTNQVSDGANLGGTAIWSGVSGVNRPQDNASADIAFIYTGDQPSANFATTGNSISKVAGPGTASSTNGNTGVVAINSPIAGATRIAYTGIFAPQGTLIGFVSGVNRYIQSILVGFETYGGNVFAWVNGAAIPVSLGTHDANTKFELIYDNTKFIWALNGVAVKTLAASPGMTLTPHYHLVTVGCVVSNIVYETYSDNNWNSVGGLGKPTDYADQTSLNTAQYVANQGYLATLNSLNLGSNYLKDSAGNLLTDAATLNNQNAFVSTKSFNFDGGSLQGAYSTGTASLAASSSGILTVNALNGDPFFYVPVNMAGAKTTSIRMRARPLSASPTAQLQVYYGTAGHGDDAALSKLATNPRPIVQNTWVILEWDMSTISDWLNSTITNVRFDLANNQQHWEVDWIEFGYQGLNATGARGIADGATVGATLNSNFYSSLGALLNDGSVITSQGTALYLTNQGGLATLNSISGDTHLSGMLATRLQGASVDYNYLSAGRVAWGAGNTVEALKPQEAGANATEGRTARYLFGQGTGATANNLAGLNTSEGTKFAGISPGAGTSLTLYSGGPQHSIVGNSVTRTGDGWSTTGDEVYSRETYPTAIASGTFVPGGAEEIFGLTDGVHASNAASYLRADFCWYRNPEGNVQPLLHNNAGAQSTPGPLVAVDYNAVYAISHDGVNVTWTKNGAQVYSIAAPYTDARPYRLIVCNNGSNTTVTGLQFSPFNNALWGAIGGANKPENGADVTGTHTARYFQDQGAFATLNQIDLNNSARFTYGARFAASSYGADWFQAERVAWGNGTGGTLQEWKPGEPGANITENRTARYLSGQGSLATQNNVAYSNQISGLPPSLLYSNMRSDGAGNYYVAATAVAWSTSDGLSVAALRPAEAGANITENRTALYLKDQGFLATQNYADWSTRITGAGKPANNAGTSLILRSSGGVTLNANGGTVDQRGVIYSGVSYVGGARMEFVVPQGVHLHAFLSTDDSDTGDTGGLFGEAFGFAGGNYYYTVNGGFQQIGSHSGSLNDRWVITYNGSTVTLEVNNVVQRTVPAESGRRVFMKFVMFNDSWGGTNYVRDIQFGPNNDNSWSGIAGAAKPADYATADVVFVSPYTASYLTITGNKVVSSPSHPGDWSSFARSSVSYVGGARVSAKLDTIETFVGLTDDNDGNGGGNNQYTTLSYSWHYSSNGNHYIFEKGNAIYASTTRPDGVAYTPDMKFEVYYDGYSVTYTADDYVIRNVTVAQNQTLWAAVSFANVGRVVSQIRFSANADTTVQNVHTLTPQSSVVTLQANYQGQVNAGQLPKTISLRRMKGTNDLSAVSDYSISATAGLGVTLNNTYGDDARGTVSINSMGVASGTVLIQAVYGGIAQYAVVTVGRQDAAPPAPTGSTGGSTGGGTIQPGSPASDNTFVVIGSNTGHIVISDVLTVNVGSSGNVALTAPLSFNVQSQGAIGSGGGTYNEYPTLYNDADDGVIYSGIALKWQYSTDGNSWNDVGSETYGGGAYNYFSTTVPKGSRSGAGYCECSATSSGWGAGAVARFRLLGRLSEGNNITGEFGTATATPQ